MAADPLPRLRTLCLALSGTQEVLSHGTQTYRVRDKQFAVFASPDNHHGNGRPAVWLKAGAGNQEAMVRAMPDRFFVPPYVGPRGWVGVWLDRRVRWSEVKELVADAYWLIAKPAKPNGGPGPRREPARRTRPGS